MTARILTAAMRRTLRTAFVGMAALVAALAVPSDARAVSVNTTLDTLVAGGANQAGIVIGDKRYSNFTFSSSGDAPVPVNAVSVALSTVDNNRYDLRFSFEREALASIAGQTTDAVICYQIDVIGNQQINSVGLTFESSVGQGSTGLAAASVTETISRIAPLGTDVGLITVFNDGTGGLPDNSTTTLSVTPPSSTLYFCKDILVSSRPEGGRVVISTVDNFVNQVPEPGSIAALAIAGGALLVRRRRGA
jgi:hypothetical protein